MNILDAVKEVLIEAGHELSAKELAEQVICKGLWSSRGKTPDATIAARIYVNIKKIQMKLLLLIVDIKNLV